MLSVIIVDFTIRIKDDLMSITNQVMLLRSKRPSHLTMIEFTQSWNNDTIFTLVEDGRARMI